MSVYRNLREVMTGFKYLLLHINHPTYSWARTSSLCWCPRTPSPCERSRKGRQRQTIFHLFDEVLNKKVALPDIAVKKYWYFHVSERNSVYFMKFYIITMYHQRYRIFKNSFEDNILGRATFLLSFLLVGLIVK